MLVGGGGGGGKHWLRSKGPAKEEDGKLVRTVEEVSPGGAHRVELQHEATPAEEDAKEKEKRVNRNKTASKRARKSLDIGNEVRQHAATAAAVTTRFPRSAATLRRAATNTTNTTTNNTTSAHSPLDQTS